MLYNSFHPDPIITIFIFSFFSDCSTGDVSMVELPEEEIDLELLTPEEMDWILADERLDGFRDGWLDGWLDGWMDSWLDCWMDGWMDEYIMNLPRLTPEEMDNI